jgi:hypothetical protein
MAEVTGGTAAWCDRLLDGVVVLLATWTVAYDVCVLLRLGTGVALLIWMVTLVVAGFGLHAAAAPDDVAPVDSEPSDPPREGTARVDRTLRGVAIGAALIAALAEGLSWSWFSVWVPWFLAGGCGVVWASRRLGRRSEPLPASPPPAPAGGTGLAVLAWAFALAAFSLWTLRPNPDDLFYVNVSEWVAVHGDFPVRDTLFSDLLYPMANWPPVASYEGLVGMAARFTDAGAATVEYVVVTPTATFLAVLTLWRLMRAWRVRRVIPVMSTALTLLLLDGTSSYATQGNLFLTRLWQGKVILLCVLVPYLLVHSLRYVERPSPTRLPPLLLGSVAAVGLSTTGIFLVPVVAAAGMAPLALRQPRRALLGFLALATYPLGAGAVTIALHGRSADEFGERRLYRFDAPWIGHQLLLTELVGFVVVLAVLLGALLVPHPQARLTTGLLALAMGYVFVPGAMRASYDVTGLGPTLWRLSWGVPVAALVGILAGYGGSRLLQRWHVLRRPAVATVVPCVVTMALLAVFGRPIWAPETGTEIRSPFHWQRTYSSRDVAARVLGAAHPGDIVLAPDALSITIAVTTTAVKTVAPRAYYMAYLEDEATFHYSERLALVRYVNDDSSRAGRGIAHDLRVVGVAVACTMRSDHHRFDVIRNAGFRPFVRSQYYRCLIRARPT